MISTTVTNESTHTIVNNYTGYLVGSDSSTNNRNGNTLEYKQTYFVYMGMAGIPSDKAIINFAHDATSITGASWAEIGIFRGNFALGGTASLTNLGATGIEEYLINSGTATVGGSIKNVAVTMNPAVRQGDHIWVGYGISASTMPSLHTSPHTNPAFPGTVQMVSNVMPSNLTGPFATTGLTNSAFRPVIFKLTIY